MGIRRFIGVPGSSYLEMLIQGFGAYACHVKRTAWVSNFFYLHGKCAFVHSNSSYFVPACSHAPWPVVFQIIFILLTICWIGGYTKASRGKNEDLDAVCTLQCYFKTGYADGKCRSSDPGDKSKNSNSTSTCPPECYQEASQFSAWGTAAIQLGIIVKALPARTRAHTHARKHARPHARAHTRTPPRPPPPPLRNLNPPSTHLSASALTSPPRPSLLAAPHLSLPVMIALLRPTPQTVGRRQ
jgi:hypothetical protein